MPYSAMGMHSPRGLGSSFTNMPLLSTCVLNSLVFVANDSLLCVHEGSGDLAALGILEDGFKHDMEVPG